MDIPHGVTNIPHGWAEIPGTQSVCNVYENSSTSEECFYECPVDSTRSLCDLDFHDHVKCHDSVSSSREEDFVRSWDAPLEGSPTGLCDRSVSMSADDTELYLNPCILYNQDCLQEFRRNAPATPAYPWNMNNEDRTPCAQRRPLFDLRTLHGLSDPPYVLTGDLRHFACMYEPCCHEATRHRNICTGHVDKSSRFGSDLLRLLHCPPDELHSHGTSDFDSQCVTDKHNLPMIQNWP
ncbi:unnamed protein product [Acanthoscelides obtectus]|uniref:Uncharacterized protein n=1 Tax=Acanthoscelides obtectus TaxID=200917 RepID=A0A9P0JJS3_ACAOB|nr:unnamed protein product [Acanthoscelides obtectus]CAK1639981.1 hypothetical protein AOBTE_LOCUS11482 [Acanthoscelides obtectus]